jgi:hypothetical protein
MRKFFRNLQLVLAIFVALGGAAIWWYTNRHGGPDLLKSLSFEECPNQTIGSVLHKTMPKAVWYGGKMHSDFEESIVVQGHETITTDERSYWLSFYVNQQLKTFKIGQIFLYAKNSKPGDKGQALEPAEIKQLFTALCAAAQRIEPAK